MLNISYPNLLKLLAAGILLAISSIFLFDETLYLIVHPAFIDHRALWEKITYIGDSDWMIALCLIAIVAGLLFNFFRPSAFWKKTWRAGAFAFLSVAPVALTVLFFKGAIGRARPHLYDAEGPLSFMLFSFEELHAGFPSGHTTTAFAFATALAILFPRLALPAFALAALAGFSRLALDEHYLADVIAGATLGTVCTIMAAKYLAPKLKIATGSQ